MYTLRSVKGIGCALSQRIKRMESEFQLEFAALVFQSHSEIMQGSNFNTTCRTFGNIFTATLW